MTEGNEVNEPEPNINQIIPIFVCFKKRDGTTCPPESDCIKPGIECKNSTQCCVSSSDPLVRFYLFTPSNKKNPEFLHECGGKLPRNTAFDRNLKTMILIHGVFDGPCRTAVWREIKDQLFVRGNYNVILVDWSRLNFPDIYDALNANEFVGITVACLIENIMLQTGITADKFHLVGHSMGSHISGFAGQHIKKCGFPLLGRITALDPSNFGYFGYPRDRRLSDDDASCIDAIHTNIGDCFPLFIGYKINIGHADFYVNGGSIQLSCYPFLVESFLKGDLFTATISFLKSFCYHLMAPQYYKVSITPCACQFVGVKCKDYKEFKSGVCRTCGKNDSSCAVMGFDFENYNGPCSGSHQYFLTTTLTCPYCDNSNIRLNGFPENSAKENPGLHCFESNKKI